MRGRLPRTYLASRDAREEQWEVRRQESAERSKNVGDQLADLLGGTSSAGSYRDAANDEQDHRRDKYAHGGGKSRKGGRNRDRDLDR